MHEVVIVDGTHTSSALCEAITARTATELGAITDLGPLDRTCVAPARVTDVIRGRVGQFGEDGYLARRSSLKAVLPFESTLKRQRDSGRHAVNNERRRIRLGKAETAVAAGTGHISAEQERHRVAREAQDRFAPRNQHLAAAATEPRGFAARLVTALISTAAGRVEATRDERPRPNRTLNRLALLAPAFIQDGIVITVDAVGINEDAEDLPIISPGQGSARGLRPRGQHVATAMAGVEPSMGVRPVPAARETFARAGMTPSAFDTLSVTDLIELNEAFQAQAVACPRELGLDEVEVDANGGAIARGHPVGASASSKSPHCWIGATHGSGLSTSA